MNDPRPSDTGLTAPAAPTGEPTAGAVRSVKEAIDLLVLRASQGRSIAAERAALASAVGLLAGQTPADRAYIVRELWK